MFKNSNFLVIIVITESFFSFLFYLALDVAYSIISVFIELKEFIIPILFISFGAFVSYFDWVFIDPKDPNKKKHKKILKIISQIAITVGVFCFLNEPLWEQITEIKKQIFILETKQEMADIFDNPTDDT